MSETVRDNNKVVTQTGVLNTDGVTVKNWEADPTYHILDVLDATTGSDFGKDLAARDNSGWPVAIAASETDGETPVNLYIDSNGNLLIDST